MRRDAIDLNLNRDQALLLADLRSRAFKPKSNEGIQRSTFNLDCFLRNPPYEILSGDYFESPLRFITFDRVNQRILILILALRPDGA